MRVKTDEKRREILVAAAAVFEERGFQNASMSAISARLGGSKSTIYGYFKSKEELFVATVSESLEPEGMRVEESLQDDSRDVGDALREFGYRYLALISSPDIMVLFHTGSSGVDPALGPLLYDRGPRRMLSSIETYLRRQVGLGRLTIGSAKVAALQLKCLIECGILEPLLFNVPAELSPEQAVDAAIDTFLAAYGSADHAG